MGVENGFNGPENGKFTSSTADALKGVQSGAEAEDIWGDANEVAAAAKAQQDSELSAFGKFKANRAEKKANRAAEQMAAKQMAQDFETTAPVDPASEAVWDEPIPGTEPAPAPTVEAAQPYTEEVEEINWDDEPVSLARPKPANDSMPAPRLSREETGTIDWDEDFNR